MSQALLLTMIAFLASFTSVQGDTKDVIMSCNRLASNMYQIVRRNEGNVIFCPLTSHFLFTLLMYGARGHTAEELKTVLSLSRTNNEQMKNNYKNLLLMLEPKISKLATLFLIKDGVTANPEFQTVAKEYFQTDIKEIDYSKKTAADTLIIEFVEKNKHCKIHDEIRIGSVANSTKVVLLNAAYFKDKWFIHFQEVLKGPFYLSKDKKVTTSLMKIKKIFSYVESAFLNAKALQISFENTKYTAIFILPNNNDGLQELEDKLATVTIQDISRNFTKEIVFVQIPKFEIEAEHDIKFILQELGVKKLFNDADLGSIISHACVQVSEAKQKTYIRFYEYGVEAIAAKDEDVQAGDWRFLPRQNAKYFTANRPFVFAILYEDLILFQGRFSVVGDHMKR